MSIQSIKGQGMVAEILIFAVSIFMALAMFFLLFLILYLQDYFLSLGPLLPHLLPDLSVLLLLLFLHVLLRIHYCLLLVLPVPHLPLPSENHIISHKITSSY
ncbi:hypothetical protein HRED_09157 [Candidatus Haloredivivus sp. G17]|nr:hypothetical protein HRED_09157 [Candidatus Haloredivivus sp. G17]